MARDYYRFAGFTVVIRLFSTIPAAVIKLLVYMARRVKRWHFATQAENWPRTNATVSSSYELDENQSAVSVNGWGDEDDEDDNEYHACWAVAIQYSYKAEDGPCAGIYFLPNVYSDSELASRDGRAWVGRKIVVRYNPAKPRQSAFLVQDGAPGQPHIPKLLSYRPYLTELSLK